MNTYSLPIGIQLIIQQKVELFSFRSITIIDEMFRLTVSGVIRLIQRTYNREYPKPALYNHEDDEKPIHKSEIEADGRAV